jgi:hypothetical protein
MPSRLDEFRSASAQAGTLVKAALVGGIAAPLLDFVLDFGPPWPGRAVAILTSIGELLVASLVFDRYRTASAARKKSAMTAMVTMIAISLIGYIALTSENVHVHPRSGERIVGGFEVRGDVQPLIGPGYSVYDALRDAGHDPTSVWTSRSITATRLSLLVLWFMFFLNLASYLMLFVLRSSASTQKPKKGAAPLPDKATAAPSEQPGITK